MDKKTLRNNILEKRNSLSLNERTEYDKKILQNLMILEEYKHSRNIMIYMSYKSEVSTKNIISQLFINKKNIILPKVDVNKKELILVKINKSTKFTKSNYGILEPIVQEDNICSIDSIDLILAPGIAFDMKGNRLGYGGGYYDKLISNINLFSTKIYALAYECQLVPLVPTEVYDKKINGLITESKIYNY